MSSVPSVTPSADVAQPVTLDYASADTASAPEAPPASMKGRALRASAWTVATQLSAAVLRMGSNLLLSYLLVPEHFGVMALVIVFINGLAMFSDIGLGPNIIRSDRGDDPAFYNTVWTVQVIRGFLIWLGTCALAWPAARIYSAPGLVWYLPVAGLAAIIYGFSSTSIYTMNRNLDAGRSSVLTLSQLVLNMLVMGVWAWIHPSVWALVAGYVSGQLFRTVMSHFMVGHVRNRFHWDRAAAGEMLHFGKWIFVSTLITFFALQIDRLLLGKVSGLGMLGVYTIAMTVATMPRDFSVSLLEQVLYPLLAEKARQGHEQMKQTLGKARRVVLPFAMFSLLGVVLGSQLFFTYLYKEDYHAAGWIAQWLCLSVWLTVLRSSVDRALLAMGDSRTQAASELAKLLATVAACLVGYHHWQLKGFIAGLAAGALAGHAVVVWQLCKHGIARVGEDLRYTAWLLALGLLGVTAPRYLYPHVWPGASLLTVTLLVAAVILGATGVWVAMRLKSDLWSVERRPS